MATTTYTGNQIYLWLKPAGSGTYKKLVCNTTLEVSRSAALIESETKCETLRAAGSITNDTTSGTTHYPLLTTATSGALSGVTVSSTKLSFVPSTGTVTATDFAATSDANLKNVIRNIQNATDKIKNISGVEFTWNNIAKNIGVSDSEEVQIGVLAHQIKQLYPSMVYTHEDGYMRVNYDKLIPILIESIKELSDRIDSIQGK